MQQPLSSIENNMMSRGVVLNPKEPNSTPRADTTAAPPVFDIQPFLQGQDGRAVKDLARGIAQCLHCTGCVLVRDPRVQPHDNRQFLDMMEQYFSQPTEAKMPDARPDLHYQVGVTPEGVEVPKAAHDAAIQALIDTQPAEHRATPLAGDGADPKWRFMTRIGERPATTQFAELNAAPVVPAGFEDWNTVMTGWGGKMLACLSAVAELAAEGFGMRRSAFVDRMAFGPHLLAPTGADLEKHGQVGQVIAGFHSDLNFLTIHGKSRYPGLYVWLRDGTRVPVRIPDDGCLFIQAGLQMEWLTGGHVKAGMHEVVCTEATVQAIDAARQAGRSLWRVSSTVFGHIASDQLLTPLGDFATPQAQAAYQPILAGHFVEKELEGIRLKSQS